MTACFGKVGILYGGHSSERQVSLMSGAYVYKLLIESGVNAQLFDTGLHNLTALIRANFDLVFIALHGSYGEDGTIQGILELMKIPYTGSNPIASSLAIHKAVSKKIWMYHRLPTPSFFMPAAAQDLGSIPKELQMPVIIKPACEGSTLGLTKVTSEVEVLSAYTLATKFGPDVLIEKYISGREITVAILGTGSDAYALPIIEIIAPNGNYNYDNKYFSRRTHYRFPTDLSTSVRTHIYQIALAAYRVLGCRGWGRVDLILDPAEKPWLLEINTTPGMTNHSLVPMAAEAAGMSHHQLCIEVLKSASCQMHYSRDL